MPTVLQGQWLVVLRVVSVSFLPRALHVPAASWSGVSLRGNPWDDDLHHLASWRTRVNATTAMHPSVCIVKQDVSLANNTFRNKPRGRASRGAKIYKADYALILHRDSFPSCRRAEAKGKAWRAGLHSAGNKAEDKKGRSKSKLEISWLAMRSRRTRRSNQFTGNDSLESNYVKIKSLIIRGWDNNYNFFFCYYYYIFMFIKFY